MAPSSFTSLPKDYHPPNRLNVFTLITDKDCEPSAQEDTPMVIKCAKCHTEYQFNKILLQEAKMGMYMYCHKCRCFFDVLVILPSSQDDEATDQVNS